MGVDDLVSAMKALPSAWESDKKLIISLDFGTTYSGIAYCFTNQRNSQVTAVDHWPGIGGESVPKIPTVINYSLPGPEDFAWGATVDRQPGNILGIKLLLDPSQDIPHYLPTSNIKQDLRKLPKPAIDVAADFISAIYSHALSEISKKVPKNYVDMCQKEFVLSVPAVWSDTAKHATMQAAKRARMFPVTLIKEPEAAALYTLYSLDFTLDIGDAFVVCDAGGGTVDLISYEVEEVSPQLKLKELVPGNGGRAGSQGLNQRFSEAVANLVGDDQWYELKRSKGFAVAERQFDREIKKAFRGNPEEEYHVNFPMADLEDDRDSKLDSNTWTMTGNDLKGIFQPLITDIIRLIDEQVKSVQIKRPEKGVTGIFLVGGFGSSQYLKACVERKIPGITVLQPNDAWGAIAKGAVLSKIPKEAAVVSVSATKHYGVEALSRFDSLLDDGMPIVNDEYTGDMRVNKMTWYINIDDDLRRDQTIKFPFYRTIDEDFKPSELLFSDELFECSDPRAPRHKSKSRGITVNCTLETNLQDVPTSKFKRETDKDGKPYYEVHYDLVVSVASALMSFSLEFEGKSFGVVEAKFS